LLNGPRNGLLSQNEIKIFPHGNSIRMTRLSIAVFVVLVVLGPVYTVDNYSHITNLISELGAQQTKNNFIMIIGFLILGLGILLDSYKKMSYPVIPFALFGIFMVMAGIFPHKPIDTSISYNHTFHSLHSLSATLAGISISIGFIWQGFLSLTGVRKILCFYLATACFVFPMLMLAATEYQGILQRLMYLQVFAWLWIMFPGNIISGKPLQP
jgi:hypothetical membrane protein